MNYGLSFLQLKTFFYSGLAPQSAIIELQNLVELHVLPLMTVFRDKSSKESPTFKHWDNLIVAIHILMLDIRAEHNGDWPLSKHATLSKTPYYACGDKTNYTRSTSIFLMDMIALPADAEAAFMKGEFSVRETSGTFTGTTSDMATEHKIKELKGPAGLKHISTKKSAMIRFSLTRHITGDWSTYIKERAHPKNTEKPQLHKEEGKTAMVQGDECVRKLVSQINNNMWNPFKTDGDLPNVLINISTGMHATPEVEKDLLDCVKTGKKKFEIFVERSLSAEGQGNFHDPIKKSNLKTFKGLNKSMKINTSQGVKEMKINPEMIFRRSIALTRFRSDLSLLSLLSLPTGGAPLSIFYEDGLMRKPIKADLAHMLEEGISHSNSWPECHPNMSVYVVDISVHLHKTPAQHFCKTFGELIEHLLLKILKYFSHVNIVICVFDQYNDPNDVKAYERRRRATGGHKKYNVKETTALPKWNQFLEVDDNKMKFNEVMSEYFVKNAPSKMKDNQRLILTGGFEDGTLTKEIKNNSIIELPHMKTNQLEADYRMIFMANQIHNEFINSNTKGTIIFYSTDTDVLVLACHHAPQFFNADVFWETGTTTKYENTHRFVPVNEIINRHGKDMMKILPQIHALSGCDTTSALYYIGKKMHSRLFQNMVLKIFLIYIHFLKIIVL